MEFPSCPPSIIPRSTSDRPQSHHRSTPTNGLALHSCLCEQIGPGAFRCARSRPRGSEIAAAADDGSTPLPPLGCSRRYGTFDRLLTPRPKLAHRKAVGLSGCNTQADLTTLIGKDRSDSGEPEGEDFGALPTSMLRDLLAL